MLKCRFHKSVQITGVGHKLLIVDVSHGQRNQVYSVIEQRQITMGVDREKKNNNNNSKSISKQSFRNL